MTYWTGGARIPAVFTILVAVAMVTACTNPTASDDGPVPTYAHGDGVPLNSRGIAGWAKGLGPGGYERGPGAEAYTNPDRAIGPASGIATDVVVLGQGGSIVLDMGTPFGDTPGADFAVWENGIAVGNLVFLELGRVAVSSNGADFATFPVTARRDTAVRPGEAVDPGLYDGFAGVHPVGTGIAFDLSKLSQTEEVTQGWVDLSKIQYVRITDVVGGKYGENEMVVAAEFDDQDPPHPIYDPFPTIGTAGFDLDGVAVLW